MVKLRTIQACRFTSKILVKKAFRQAVFALVLLAPSRPAIKTIKFAIKRANDFSINNSLQLKMAFAL